MSERTVFSRLPIGQLALTILIVGLSLRVSIMSVAPLLDRIKTDLGISATLAGLLTTIPVICFGVVSPLAPAIARRFSMERAILWMSVLAIIGILIRTVASPFALYGGTVLIGAAIAIINVLLPGFVKREAPGHVGPMTALYSAAMSGSGALGAGLTIPIMKTTGLGWRDALGWGVIISLTAAILMVPWALSGRSAHLPQSTHRRTINVWRNPLAWWVTGYMGAQSIVFFSVTGWLPTYLIDHGMSESAAGFTLSMSPLFGVAGSFCAPLLVGRRRDQRWLVWLSSALCAAGVIGLLLIPTTWTMIWVALFGFGSGMTLSLALTFIGLRSPDSAHAAELSSMAQSVGYLIAAAGPLAVGIARDLTGNWQMPFTLILVMIVGLTITGLASGNDRLIAPRQASDAARQGAG